MFITIYLVIGAIVAGWSAYLMHRSEEFQVLVGEECCFAIPGFLALAVVFVLDLFCWPITVIYRLWIGYKTLKEEEP